MNLIEQHYSKHWGSFEAIQWKNGPMKDNLENFRVLRFPPHGERDMWTYATCGMSSIHDDLEVHLFSPEENDDIAEILTALAYYHCFEAQLGEGHTVNFGQPWFEDSIADYGFISLPYLDGPELEIGGEVRFLWLIPITKQEVEYKKQYGLEALENKFEELGLDYLNPYRDSLV